MAKQWSVEMMPDSALEPLRVVQAECQGLRKRLVNQNTLQHELESIKEELEKVLETHKTLQNVALLLEEKNRTLQEQYKTEVRERLKLDETKLDLEHELESSKMSYEGLDKRFQKLKDKMSESESLEDMVYQLEKDKRKAMEKVEKLQEEIQTLQDGSGAKSKELTDKIIKLTKENKELNVKLETYFEEMEEMDTKCEELENENSSLKKQYQQIKSIELVGSNITEISDLEFQKSELEAKLQKEVDKRETVENELFKIEEEFETFKIEVEERDAKLEVEISKVNVNLFEGRKVSNTSVKTFDDNVNSVATTSVALPDEAVKFLIRKKQKTIDNLEKENDSLHERLKSFEHEHEILLDDNSNLAKSNMQQDEKLQQLQTRSDNKIAELEQKLEKAREEQKKVEQESMARLMNSAEKELEYNQNCDEVKSLKSELNNVQEYLRVMEKEKQEFQIELEEIKRGSVYQRLNDHQLNMFSQYHQQPPPQYQQHLQQYQGGRGSRSFSPSSHIEQQAMNGETSSTSSLNSQESEILLSSIQRKAVRFDEEREREYESKINHQNNVIRALEDRIQQLREKDDPKIDFQPEYNNNNGEQMSSPETTPPVAIRNGRLHDSMDELSVLAPLRTTRRKSVDFSDDELDSGDTLSDKDLRRISFRMAEGSWKHLSTDLNIKRRQEINQIVNSGYEETEKIYRLLVTWKSELADNLTRDDLLRELIDRVSSKRKDVVKLLKEMLNGKQNKDAYIKTKFQKFKRSVKR